MGIVKGKSIIESYKLLEQACADLRYEVEHQGGGSSIILLGATYKATDPNAIKTVKVDGVEVGYQIKHIKGAHFMRKVYVKIPGYKWSELKRHELDKIIGAVLDGTIEVQTGDLEIDLISPDCYLISQVFDVAFQIEKNPDLRSIAGGVNLDKDGKIVNS